MSFFETRQQFPVPIGSLVDEGLTLRLPDGCPFKVYVEGDQFFRAVPEGVYNVQRIDVIKYDDSSIDIAVYFCDCSKPVTFFVRRKALDYLYWTHFNGSNMPSRGEVCMTVSKETKELLRPFKGEVVMPDPKQKALEDARAKVHIAKYVLSHYRSALKEEEEEHKSKMERIRADILSAEAHLTEAQLTMAAAVSSMTG